MVQSSIYIWIEPRDKINTCVRSSRFYDLINTIKQIEIDLMEDDIFYLFSDGYADQFGGTENKKFMYRRFRYLLLTIHKFPVEDQKAILEENFRTWIGRNEQVDDILVIGFKPLG